MPKKKVNFFFLLLFPMLLPLLLFGSTETRRKKNTHKALHQKLIHAIRNNNLQQLKEIFEPKPKEPTKHIPSHVYIDRFHTVVHKATLYTSPETFRYLCQKVPIELINSRHSIEGGTPLHWAAVNGLPDIIDILLDEGAHIDQQNNLGQTPLFAACNSERHATVIHLLKRGASPDIPNHKRVYPYQLASYTTCFLWNIFSITRFLSQQVLSPLGRKVRRLTIKDDKTTPL